MGVSMSMNVSISVSLSISIQKYAKGGVGARLSMTSKVEALVHVVRL